MSDLIIGVPMDYEPKRNNRFFAEFPSEVGIEVWKVRKFSRPKISIEAVEIPYINETNYVSGKYKWSTVTVELMDTIGPSTSQQVMEWVRLHAESVTGRMGYKAGSAKNIILKALDPNGVTVEKWTLEQCIITEASFGDNDMGSDEVQMITLTLQPYRCILNV